MSGMFKSSRFTMVVGGVILIFIEALIKGLWLYKFPLTETLSAQTAIIVGYITNRTWQRKWDQ